MQKVKLFEQYLNEGLIFSDETTDIFQAMESLATVLKKENQGYYSLNKVAFLLKSWTNFSSSSLSNNTL